MWVPEVTLGRLIRTQADPGRVRDDGLDSGVPLLLYSLTTESSRAGGQLAHGGRRKPCCAPRASASSSLRRRAQSTKRSPHGPFPFVVLLCGPGHFEPYASELSVTVLRRAEEPPVPSACPGHDPTALGLEVSS